VFQKSKAPGFGTFVRSVSGVVRATAELPEVPFSSTFQMPPGQAGSRVREFQRSVQGPGMIAGGSDHHRPLEIPGCQVHRCLRVTETILQS